MHVYQSVCVLDEVFHISNHLHAKNTCSPQLRIFFFKERLAHGVKQCTNVSCLLMPNASLIPNPNSPGASEANFIIAVEIQQLSDVRRLGLCRWLPAGPEGFPGAKFWSLCIHR